MTKGEKKEIHVPLEWTETHIPSIETDIIQVKYHIKVKARVSGMFSKDVRTAIPITIGQPVP